MQKIKIGFIGTGWRAHGYMRVIRELSDQMEVAGVLVRREERLQEMDREYPGKIYIDPVLFLSQNYDFVMVLVPRQEALFYVEMLAQRHIPVLAETPPANGLEELNRCYEIKEKYQAKIQVAEQYFNYFRTRHIRIQGELGEICDLNAAWMGKDGYPVKGTILRDSLGEFSNLEGYQLRALTLNGERIYENPLRGDYRLSDDEIAMAGLLLGMKRYVDGGEEIYPLEEALQDTYLYLLMDQAIKEQKCVCSEIQRWHK